MTACLRSLKTWAGDPSFTVICERINRAGVVARRGTVVDCFKAGRRRIDADLVVSVVRALHDDRGYVERWRQALRAVGHRMTAASQVRVLDALPRDLPEFTGRDGELRRLAKEAEEARAGFVASIQGMAGAGKTQFAVRLGHLLARRRPFATVLFVNLRGFHPDPQQPPADPGAVLDGFLRRLGVPAHRIPSGVAERSAAVRSRLSGTRALVVLDDAVDSEQIGPLVAGVPGSVTLVTSRRRSGDADAATVTADLFTMAEARDYLARAVPGVAPGDDPDAVARIVARCGGLPLALSLVAGHIRRTPGWTLTDHADRLDRRRVDSDVETALNLSYRHLTPERRRLLRMVALHPGPDIDRHAAAAMAGIDPDAARADLDDLGRDHLVRPSAPDRFVLHDLVRAFVMERAVDEDRATARRDALTRLFDHYLAAGSAAMERSFPNDVHLRPPVAVASAIRWDGVRAARDWLDVERPAVVAAATHAAAHGWPGHAVGLSTVFYRYLVDFPSDASQAHAAARAAARAAGDARGEAYALLGLGAAKCERGHHVAGAGDVRRALALFRRTGDRLGQARALSNLGIIACNRADFPTAMTHMRRALALFERLGNPHGAANALNSVGFIDIRLGNAAEAVAPLRKAVRAHRSAGYLAGEARALTNLGNAEYELGRHAEAADHLSRAVDISHRIGNPLGEATAWECVGVLNTRRGDAGLAAEALGRALGLFREAANQPGEARTLNSQGDLAMAAADPTGAAARYGMALTVALEAGSPDQKARAQTGLAAASSRVESARPAWIGGPGASEP